MIQVKQKSPQEASASSITRFMYLSEHVIDVCLATLCHRRISTCWLRLDYMTRNSSKPKMRPSIRRSACSWSQTSTASRGKQTWQEPLTFQYISIILHPLTTLRLLCSTLCTLSRESFWFFLHDPCLNSRSVLQVSEDLVDGKGPTKFAAALTIWQFVERTKNRALRIDAAKEEKESQQALDTLSWIRGIDLFNKAWKKKRQQSKFVTLRSWFFGASCCWSPSLITECLPSFLQPISSTISVSQYFCLSQGCENKSVYSYQYHFGLEAGW